MRNVRGGKAKGTGEGKGEEDALGLPTERPISGYIICIA